MILIVLVHASSSGQTHATISVIVNSLVSRGEESAHLFAFPFLSCFHFPMVCSVSCAMLECQEKVMSSAERATAEGKRGMGKVRRTLSWISFAAQCHVRIRGVLVEEEEEESVTACLWVAPIGIESRDLSRTQSL